MATLVLSDPLALTHQSSAFQVKSLQMFGEWPLTRLL